MASIEKKEAIQRKLNDLRAEFEKDRTHFDRFADRMMAIARLSGDIEREGAQPWWPWFKALFGLINEAKDNEEKRSLPRRSEPKKIEPPRKQVPSPKKSGDLDDEVPF